MRVSVLRVLLPGLFGLLSIAASAAHAQNLRSVPVTASDLAYSPLTNRIYASVPGGNSIVTIDPITGATVGSPLIIGSQPSNLAISDDGEYLYVGLAGASFVKRVHLPSGTIDLEFALPTFEHYGPSFVDDIEVMPGQPDTVAVALRRTSVSPRHAGVALFDHGVMRPTITGDHTGSNAIEFDSSTRLYGYNQESTEYGLRRMSISPSGLTVDHVARDLLQGFSNDFEMANGVVYGTSGLIIDPLALTVLGTFALPHPFRPVYALEPDAAAGVVYFVKEHWDTKKFWLRTFSMATQLEIRSLLLDGVTGGDPISIIRWGTNGIAFAMSTGSVWLVNNDLPTAAPPSITITSPTTEDTWMMAAGTLTLGGIASDPGGAPAQIAWSSDRGGNGAVAGSTAWQVPGIPIHPGVNTITVTVVGSTGRIATDVITVTATEQTYVMAEGATGSFFDLDIALANPHNFPVPVSISYLQEGGATTTQNLTLAPTSRTTIRVDEISGLENAAVSTVVRSLEGHPIVVERTMRWDAATQYGSHTDKATDGAATKWYFAEGAQGFFKTYLLLANPNGVSNTATVDWLRENDTPLRRVYSLQPNSRTTIFAGDDPGLVDRSFGIVVTFDTPGVADRTMYFGVPPDVLFKAGHNSAGVTAPSTSWLLAEGATGTFFDTFVLIANPNANEVEATLTFLPDNGEPVIRSVRVPGNSRRTVNIEALDPAAPGLMGAAVATEVDATGPVVVERAQYWPGAPQFWYEAHNSFGVTAPARRWGLAEGRVGNPPGFPAGPYFTYVLLANSGTVPANVTLTFLRANGTTIQKVFSVSPQSRKNVSVAGLNSDVPELVDETFGVVIDATQPIAVERAMYNHVGNQLFGAGTNATATRLP
jgi:hypothetical protein